jgi:hypothetical protein
MTNSGLRKRVKWHYYVFAFIVLKQGNIKNKCLVRVSGFDILNLNWICMSIQIFNSENGMESWNFYPFPKGKFEYTKV